MCKIVLEWKFKLLKIESWRWFFILLGVLRFFYFEGLNWFVDGMIDMDKGILWMLKFKVFIKFL